MSRVTTARTNPREWAKKVRAQTPTLLQVGKPAPKLVLSFGGCGFLVTYALGVAHYLQQERPELLSQCFLLGAGTGVLPAVALACGPAAVRLEAVRDFVVDHRFAVTNEPRRLAVTAAGINELLPRNAVDLVAGRLALTIGFSNRDAGYMQQAREQLYYGHHIAQWDSYDDLAQNIIVAMAPDTQRQMPFRDAPNVMRGTMMSFSSELDQYCRHVYIHGYVGYRYSRRQSRHNILYGRHGFLGNTHACLAKQALLAFAPHLGSGRRRREELLQAFDDGRNDARRYERWDEDAYYYAKADRTASDDLDWRNVRASLLGDRGDNADRFEL